MRDELFAVVDRSMTMCAATVYSSLWRLRRNLQRLQGGFHHVCAHVHWMRARVYVCSNGIIFLIHAFAPREEVRYDGIIKSLVNIQTSYRNVRRKVVTPLESLEVR